MQSVPLSPVVNDTLPRRNGELKHYLALGDSYTIGQSVPVSDRFPVLAVTALRQQGYQIADADIIATTGWTTGDLINALVNASPTANYDLVTLLIGVNNQYQGASLQQYRNQFTSLLESSIKLAQNKPLHVIVISIPDYSVTPFAAGSDKKKIADEIDAFNLANKEISSAYGVNYVNVTSESRKAASDPTLVASDGLHFSGKEHRVWVDLLLPAMKQALQ